MEDLQRSYRVCKLNITRIDGQVKALIKTRINVENLAKLENLLTEFREEKTKYASISDQILGSFDESDKDYAKNIEKYLNEAATISNLFAEYQGQVTNFRKQFASEFDRESLLSHTMNQSFSLPKPSFAPKLDKIKLPSFDGNILDFRNFRSMFDNVVHSNPELTNVQKLYYLKQALMGEASLLIRDFPLTENAYAEAYQYLVKRFDNKRMVTRELFKGLSSLEPIKTESKIQALLDQMEVIIRGLKVNGENIDSTFSRYIAYIVSSKLDSRTLKDWENSFTSFDSFPTYDDLREFLQQRSFAIIDSSTSKPKPSSNSSPKSPPSSRKTKSTFSISSNSSSSTHSLLKPSSSSSNSNHAPSFKPQCSFCPKDHYITNCTDFMNLSPLQRFERAKGKHLCIKCLRSGHLVIDCRSGNCRECQGKHHTLLHRDVKSNPVSKPSSPLSSASPSTTTSANPETKTALSILSNKSQSKTIVLPTAVVFVKIRSKVVLARVLLDSASQATLVNEDFVSKHRLSSFVNSSSQITISGITGDSVRSNSIATLNLKSRVNSFELTVHADIVRNIPFAIDSDPICRTTSKYPNRNFAEMPLPGNQVDILLGAEYFESCILNESQELQEIFHRNSQFGWVISGPFIVEKSPSNQFCNLTTIDIQDQLRRFWEIEEADTKPEADTEHQQCQEFFAQTTVRDKDGRFVVKLPFKIDRNQIGESRSLAISNLKRIETKYDNQTREAYIAFMSEYEQLNHMSKVPSTTEKGYYIPHRAVLRPESTTTKLRVVFNASAKSSSNLSLNDCLMVGPSIQPQLTDILIRFRQHNIAWSADIPKMYRCIIVDQSDRNMQRIVWRENPDDPILEFSLNTVTYGTGPASYIATQCLLELSKEIKDSQPTVSRAIAEDFCMDDLLSGAESEEEAIKLNSCILKQLETGGFTLRKYMSNSCSFLKTIDPEKIETLQTLEFRDSKAISVLGLKWHPNEDYFSIKLNLRDFSFIKSLSKRLILSEIARIFDPLGFISPVVIKAKIMLQSTWEAKLDWDDPVPESLRKSFEEFYIDLPNLKNLEIRRRYSLIENPTHRQLIGFCDASDKAYCAVIYLRSNSCSAIDSYLVCSKTRIAPKGEFKITIPKLELQGALLLAVLMKRVARELNIDSCNWFALCDSSVVLHWLKGDISRWSVFVQNRVRKIQAIVPNDCWYYVNTKQNAADCATRGLNASAFLKQTSWFIGPEFIRNQNLDLDDRFPLLNVADIPECRKTCNIVSVNSNASNIIIELLNKYSSFVKLINVVAYICRFVKSCKSKCNHHVRSNIENNFVLDVSDKEYATNLVICNVQLYYYSKEIALLKTNKPLSKNSTLYSLNAFIDRNGIVRVYSRLNNSSLSFSSCNPIIIPAKSRFIELFVSYVHISYYHCTRSFIRNFVLSKYHVVGGLVNVIKKVVHSCTVCIRYKGLTASQLMGQLPKARVTVSRPFNHVGIDFAGPFSCKCVAHRSVRFYKIYIAFYVCFVTRAVHLEIVSSLSTEAFLASLQRFVARRGIPSNIYSDNATNFVGANNLLNLASSSDLKKYAYEKSIKWHFIPPRAPHHGGLWEAAVKSAKHHLIRVTNGQVLNFEEYATVFSTIESILNSRPLCYRQTSNSVPELLTPGHFLVGSCLLTIDAPEAISSKTVSLSRRYELMQSQINSFWKSWSADYLNELKLRAKWQKLETNLKPQDVVLIKEPNLKPSQWMMGVIETTFSDNQGVVRTATVRTNHSSKRLAITNLIPIVRSEPPVEVHPGESV